MTDNPEEPLIANTQSTERDQDDGSHDVEHAHDSRGGKQHISPPGLFIWLLTFSAGISGLLFGYDTGVISATLVSIGTSLSHRPLTSLDKSVITSCTSLFALLALPFASALADDRGRKRVVLFADTLFIIGALCQAASRTVEVMVIGRSVVGIAIGAASFVTPLYIAELAPATHRGRLVTMNIVFITLGQVVAYVVGWIFGTYGSPETTGWRWMVGLGAVPAVCQVVILLWMPESPRWLVKDGRSQEARAVIAKIAAGDDAQDPSTRREVDAVLKSIEIEVREEATAMRLGGAGAGYANGNAVNAWMEAMRELIRVRRNRRALAIACLLQGLQQLCGFNSLMYFSATIFTMVGFSEPTLTSLVVAVTNFAFTLVALVLIDRVGRRRILLWSLPFMIAGLVLAGYGFSFIELPNSETSSPSTTGGQGGAVIILASIMIYVAGYAIGLGNVPWMQSELFSLSVRSVGSGVATATNWSANFVIGLTFLPLMEALSPSWTFVLYAVICAVGYGLIWTVYPETAGLSLEDAATLLEADDWGVR
ncbi:general substrate transporter [Neurospora crassa]|uniref:MFS myo-inositol transporter n=2 Tax=Neurospora crassa TaxID=5141 RepID=Q7SC67_NEUCR|nr:MFS myo-inositol transporter [Neurospora crassa OR74A]EAA34084.3 MFS myo-inositol transporter [Neurospora crassa OR74A]KHE87581.1 general substrate transporter [Neurospora crassa]CAD70374.1 related to myo-inositol transporter [Neurospora crassa]|eukprot:XP_963320.3 MFS myo-inositol transporter [Neurospora crassa OR74A]